MSGGLAGQLREPVRIERWRLGDELVDDPGEWRFERKSWAAIAPENVRPADDGGAMSSRRRYRITMRRWDAAAEPAGLYRLIWNGRMISLLARQDDPALPDRTMLIGEERL